MAGMAFILLLTMLRRCIREPLCQSQSFSSRTWTCSPIQEDRLIFRIGEITEFAVLEIMRSLRDSKAKDAYNMDTTFLKTYKDAIFRAGDPTICGKL